MNTKEYATWNYPLWIDNEYVLYKSKIRMLKSLGRPVCALDVYRFCITFIGYRTQDDASIDDVDLNEVASDWELERLEWISDD